MPVKSEDRPEASSRVNQGNTSQNDNEPSYISVPVLEELVRRAEDRKFTEKNASLTAACGILNYYFPPHEGFITLSQCVPIEGAEEGYMSVVQVNHYRDGAMHPYIFGEVRRQEGFVEDSDCRRVENYIDRTDCKDPGFYSMVILLYGAEISFYDINEDDLLEPHRPLHRPSRNQFHLRRDADTVHEMLKFMADKSGRHFKEHISLNYLRR
ncbi:hypothetical protein FQN54_000885 [Arachnomyces sp. PD_36]|nr:hypothetical protein FQN54_000885 [Arachnomyces sp. PD_36]